MAKIRSSLISRKEIEKVVKDYPELDAVFERLNDFMSSVASVLNSGITLADNVQSGFVQIILDPEADGRTNFPKTVVINGMKAKPAAMIILKIDDVSSGENYPVSQQRPFTLSWDGSPGRITINAAPGRDTGRSHKITALVLA